jgi:hypothetical protein
VRLDAQRETEWKMILLEQPEPCVEDTDCRSASRRSFIGHPGDVVIGERGEARDAEILERRVLELQFRCRVGEGAGALSRTKGRIGLKLPFTGGADVGSLGEAEQVLGIHSFFARSACGDAAEQCHCECGNPCRPGATMRPVRMHEGISRPMR